MADFKTSTEYYNHVCSAIASDIAKWTPQLFTVKTHVNKLPPQAFGSSVLLTVERRYFLITAAHCVHGINLEYLGIMIGNDFCSIGGNLLYFEPNEEIFNPNNSDIAVFELHDDTVEAMREKYEFMSWDKVRLQHQSNEYAKYLIFGYPASKTTKHFPTKQVIPEPLVLRTIGIPDNYYTNEKVDRNKTFILFADQRSVGRANSENIEELPELGGISGCGVWQIFDLTTNNPKYGLVALITGEGGNKTVLYCSRIDHVGNILKRHFYINVH